MARKPTTSVTITEKQYVLCNQWEDAEFTGSLSEIANYLADEKEEDLEFYSLYEMGPKLNFKFIPPKIIL